jgi:hypothetical protein
MTVFERNGLGQRDPRHLQRIALLVIIAWFYLAHAKPPPGELSGLVSIADGGPFTIIRGDSLFTGSKGVTLVTGDMIETGPGAFLCVELRGGGLLGIGPASQIYILKRAELPTLIVLKGWVKADVRANPQSGEIRVIGTRMGIQGQRAVMLLHADENSDAIFDEQGSARLLLRDERATRVDKETQPSQFFVREVGAAVVVQPRPSADFVSRMPIPFRDSLPEKASARLDAPQELRPVRAVTYSDIQPWLVLPREWRSGFIGRFRARLNDPVFFAAMDAHLGQHPEWVPILHPPPPEDEDIHVATDQNAPVTPH